MNQVPTCTNCGAPLSVAPLQTNVRCEYCGAQNQFVVRGRSLSNRVGPFPPGGAHSKASRIILLLGVALGVGFAGLVAALKLGGSGAALGSNAIASAVLEWYTPTCLVDANGDSALDIAGLGAMPGSERWTLRVLDGATGNILWSENDYAPVNGIVCLSPRFFGMEGSDFRLRLFPAKTLASPISIPLSDHIEAIGWTDDCVSIKTRDRVEKAFRLTSNALSRCDVPAVNPVWGDWGIKTESDADGLEQTSGATSYLLTHRDPGTPFLTLTARALDGKLWSTDLSVVKPSAGLAFAVTPRMLVVYGVDPRDENFGVVVGVDPQSGAQRYAVRQDSHNSASIRSLHFNGRFVLVDWGFGLHAYDPADGHRAWHIGGR